MFPHERSLVKRMANKPFAILGVNGDPDLAQANKMSDEADVSWRSFWNGPDPGAGIARSWNVSGWPTLYLIDHEGVIRNKWLGSPGDEELDLAINQLVSVAASAAHSD